MSGKLNGTFLFIFCHLASMVVAAIMTRASSFFMSTCGPT